MTNPVLEQVIAPDNLPPSPCAFRLPGVRVDALQVIDVVAEMESWIAKRSVGHFVAFTGMHGVTEAQRDASFKRILNSADLVVADGMPLVWLGRWHGCDMRRRVYGPELLEKFCCNTGPFYRHYFYGGGPGVAQRVAEVLRRRYDVRTVGTYSPPFRPLTEEEKLEVDRRIRAAAPDVLWVGLSTPKQERWMAAHRGRVEAVMLGVGAAFDFLAGVKRQAPRWMRRAGLEWLFRLGSEPRRLARRYLKHNPRFLVLFLAQLCGLREFR